jgi:hypothetical protein
MILSSETLETDAEQMLDFYKQHFAVVELVSCGVCDAFLAFECSGGDGMGLMPNEIGKYVIPIGDNLLSHRVRLDEAPTGERMMGYQCGAPVENPAYQIAVKHHEDDVKTYDKAHKAAVAAAKKGNQPEPEYNPPQMPLVSETKPCGNDTRIAEVERGLVPLGPGQSSLSPFEKHRIRQELKEKSVRPNFRKEGNIKHFESFKVERME